MTMPTFLSDLFAWFKAEEAKVVGEAKAIYDAVEPQAVKDVEDAVQQFLGEAIKAVKAQVGKVLSGKEKFSEAKDLLLQIIEAKGLTIGNTTLELLINLALSFLKISL